MTDCVSEEESVYKNFQNTSYSWPALVMSSGGSLVKITI